MRIAGRMIVPNGSMWAIGLRVRRPARFAVSSPNASATQPWEISCRITDGTRTAKKMMSARPMFTGAARAGSALRCAVDTEAGGRLGLEAGGRDRLATALARPVGAGFELDDGVPDLGQRLLQRLGQRLGLAPLCGDLTGVGKVLVVVQPTVLAETELRQLGAQARTLLLQ